MALLAHIPVVGLLVPLLTYLVREVLRLDDDTALAPVHLVGGLVGLLAVGLLSDGLAGAGWNGVGSIQFLGVAGQGVTGLWPAPGYQPDWPGQMQAQLIGIGALFLVAFLAGLVVFGLLAALAHGFRRMASARSVSGRQPLPETVLASVDVETEPAESIVPDAPNAVAAGEA